MRGALADALRPHAQIEEAPSNDEVRRALAVHAFDAVFIDIDRTDENGFQIARGVRRATTSHRVRLIAVSSFNRTSDLAASREAGFDLRVTRPIKIEQLLAALHTVRT